MPLQETSGAATYDAFGGGGASGPVVNYIEDVFSAYVYTGNGATTQSIVNNINLANKGGMVWTKSSSTTSFSSNWIYDTTRGAQKVIAADATTAQQNDGEGGATRGLYAFNANGFSLGNSWFGYPNAAGEKFNSFTFRKCQKFFDIVTYTGNGQNRTIAHNLGSTPGCIMIKTLSAAQNWIVYHRGFSTPTTQSFILNTNAAAGTGQTTYWNSTAPTSTEFSLGTGATNTNGTTYVAYLFAHNDGGFGLDGTDNVITCGSYTEQTTAQTIDLGYEPQFLFVCATTIAQSRRLYNSTTTFGVGNQFYWETNTKNGLGSSGGSATAFWPLAKGFNAPTSFWGNGQRILYIAIRRGPMKTPTSASSVFGLVARSGTNANANVAPGNFGDFVLIKNRNTVVQNIATARTLSTRCMGTSETAAEFSAASTVLQSPAWQFMSGIGVGTGTSNTLTNLNTSTYINYVWSRAPKFMDVVAYFGLTVSTTISHNLGVAPEMIWIKARNSISDWAVYSSTVGATSRLTLNTTSAQAGASSTYWNDTAPTSSVFTIGTDLAVNGNTAPFIAYLFATLAGISKIGSYTGTGTTLQIDCGFTAGARFVMIKRIDNTGDWYYWDTARGIVAGNDPYLVLNTTAVEVTNTDYIDTYSAGFEISSTAPAAINANGGTFIFMAIA